MSTDDVTLEALRQRVTDIDRQLISLVSDLKRVRV
jgi:chorismate mutase